MSNWQAWGLIMLAPYALVFLAFVLYPVTYGLWLARHPESYVKLFADPIFFRTLVNTIFFLLIAVNLKFLLALWLSGFFVHDRAWIRWLSVLFLLPWAVVFRNLGLLAFVEGVVFIAILVVALAYVWRKGDLEWVRAEDRN